MQLMRPPRFLPYLLGLALAVAAPLPDLSAQTGTIRGTVTDSASARGVAAAQISVGSRRALTDGDGRYVLAGIDAGTATVVLQRIGFARATRSVSVPSNGSVTLDVVLRPAAQTLSEVVTIGYGTTSRANVSSAIATLDSAAFARIPVASIDNAIQGKIPGVQVMQNSGEPGTGVSIRVRGPASLNAGNQPLFVVDGIPVIQENYEQLTSTSGQRQSPMSSINPDDVERIDVLKDAAATAIYGSRGSNGVVIITTKRGGLGSKMRFGLSTYAGTQGIEKKLDLLNAKDYVTVMNEARTNQGGAIRFTPGLADTATYDWQDAVFRSAGVSDAQISINGGTERVRMFLSGANYAQEGIVIGSKYGRQSGRLNLDAAATNKLQITSSVGLTREVNRRVPGDLNLDGVVTNAIGLQPFNPIYGTTFGFGGIRENLLYSNPVAIAEFNKLTNTSTRALGSLEARYSFTDAFTVTARGGADLYGISELRWRSPKVDKAVGASNGGEGSSGHTTANRFIAEGFANLDVIRNDVQMLSVTAGSSVEKNKSDLNYVSGIGFPTGFDTYVRNAASVVSYDGAATSNNLVGFFSRATWSYADRYLLTGSIRADGSSRFGESNRYGTFPAVSGAWAVTNESFATELAKLASLKLRASIGTTGNQGIGDFASRTLAGPRPYFGAAGLATTQFGNPDLRWEQTREVDFGVDITTFGGRLDIIADYYSRNTTNLLVQRPVPATSGYSSVWDNVGSLRNRGVDMGIHTINVDGTKNRFGWTTDLNVTWNRNKVTDLYRPPGDTLTPPTITFTTSSRITSVATIGQPLGSFFLYKFLSVDPATGNALYQKADGSSATYDRMVAGDLQVVGNPQPKYYGGLTNTFTAGPLDLRGFLQFNQGGNVLNLLRIFADDGGNSSDNKIASVLGRWRKPGDVTNVPRMGSTGGARLLSSRFVEDGSFVRLGEVSLGYRIPSRVLSGVRLDNARIYVSGRNLKTWTNYSGYNPDVNSTASSNVVMGVDYYAYPVARTVTLGLNAGW